jgi:hypothetical protein
LIGVARRSGVEASDTRRGQSCQRNIPNAVFAVGILYKFR